MVIYSIVEWQSGEGNSVDIVNKEELVKIIKERYYDPDIHTLDEMLAEIENSVSVSVFTTIDDGDKEILIESHDMNIDNESNNVSYYTASVNGLIFYESIDGIKTLINEIIEEIGGKRLISGWKYYSFPDVKFDDILSRIESGDITYVNILVQDYSNRDIVLAQESGSLMKDNMLKIPISA